MTVPAPMGFCGSLFFIVAFLFLSQNEKHSIIVSDIPPLVGLRNQVFRRTRALLRQLTDSSQTLAEGYKQFSKKGLSFTTPDFSFKPHVMLPQEHLRWLATQPDSVLSSHTVRSEGVGIEYLGKSKEAIKITVKYVHAIIGRFLTKNLDHFHADILDEVRASIDAEMGIGEEWHRLKLGKTMKIITDRTSCRILFGRTLSHDKRFIRSLDLFNQVFGVGFFLVGHTPWLIRPLVRTLMNLILRFYMTRAMKPVVPIMRACIQDISEGKKEGPQTGGPSDFLTQSVKFAMESKEYTFGNDAKMMAEQFILLAFATLFTSPTVATHVILDVLDTAPEANAYQRLRDEAAETFRSEADWMNPAALQRLVRTDSAIRESLRHSPFGVRGIIKEVVAEDGLVLPDGKKACRGTWVGIPVQALQMDERYYERPQEYDPFRFVKAAGDAERLEATRVSDTFLAFSYGRSACPGRWFAVHQLKVLIAYVMLNYDIEPMEKRPRNINLGDANFPSFSTQVRIRRRKQATSLL